MRSVGGQGEEVVQRGETGHTPDGNARDCRGPQEQGHSSGVMVRLLAALQLELASSADAARVYHVMIVACAAKVEGLGC